MTTKTELRTMPRSFSQAIRLGALLVAGTAMFGGTIQMYGAEDPAVQKLLADARAKEAQAQQLRAAAAGVMQKAADDQMEATADDRDAKILTAQAMKLMGADANKQKAFRLRVGARKFLSEAHEHLVRSRNAEQKAAQLTKNAEELNKAAAQLKDQAEVASTLEAEAKTATAQAQTEAQAASTDKLSAQSLEERAKVSWAEAEKLDPETHKLVAPSSPKPQLVQPRQVK